MTTTESGSDAETENRAGMRPARPWSSHRMNSSTSGCKKPNDNRRIVTDGGQPADDEPDNYIDPAAGGEDYTKIRVSVSDNELESLANGFGTTREWTTDNGETIAVFVDPKREADKDWLLEEIGAKETAEPQVYKTIGALAVFGGSLSVAATLAPAWTMIPAAIPMLVAGIWIIDELRRGYNSPQPADEEATA